MNVIKYFFKNLRANYLTFFMYVCIFIVMLMVSASGGSDRQGNIFEPTKAKVALIKKSSGVVANAIEEYLTDYMGGTVKPEVLPDDLDLARELIYMGNYDAIVRIPEDAEQRFEEDAPSVEILFNTMAVEGHIVENRLKVFMVILKSTFQDGRYDLEFAKTILKNEVDVEFTKAEQTPEEEVQRVWLQAFFNTSGYVLMAVYISLVGMGMSSFGEPKTKLRIAISSKDANRMQAEIYLAQLLLGAMITTLFVGICLLMNRNALLENEPQKFILNIAVYSMVVIALTFLINNITNNRHAKNALSTALSLGLAFISGIFIPQSMLGEKVLTFAKFFPLFYFIRVNEAVHPDTVFMAQNLGIQVLFGILYFVLGLYFGKKRRITR